MRQKWADSLAAEGIRPNGGDHCLSVDYISKSLDALRDAVTSRTKIIEAVSEQIRFGFVQQDKWASVFNTQLAEIHKHARVSCEVLSELANRLNALERRFGRIEAIEMKLDFLRDRTFADVFSALNSIDQNTAQSQSNQSLGGKQRRRKGKSRKTS